MLSNIVSFVAFTTAEYIKGASVEIYDTDMEWFFGIQGSHRW
jgi:hypothetical protein